MEKCKLLFQKFVCICSCYFEYPIPFQLSIILIMKPKSKLQSYAIFHIKLYTDIRCDDLSTPSNGEIISWSSGRVGVAYEGDTCGFTCNAGYELTGSDTRTCQSNGSWSGSDDVCRRGWFIYKFLKSRDAFIVKQFPIHLLLILIMEWSLVHWKMMEFLPMKTLVVSHVILVMS